MWRCEGTWRGGAAAACRLGVGRDPPAGHPLRFFTRYHTEWTSWSRCGEPCTTPPHHHSTCPRCHTFQPLLSTSHPFILAACLPSTSVILLAVLLAARRGRRILRASAYSHTSAADSKILSLNLLSSNFVRLSYLHLLTVCLLLSFLLVFSPAALLYRFYPFTFSFASFTFSTDSSTMSKALNPETGQEGARGQPRHPLRRRGQDRRPPPRPRPGPPLRSLARCRHTGRRQAPLPPAVRPHRVRLPGRHRHLRQARQGAAGLRSAGRQPLRGLQGAGADRLRPH